MCSGGVVFAGCRRSCFGGSSGARALALVLPPQVVLFRFRNCGWYPFFARRASVVGVRIHSSQVRSCSAGVCPVSRLETLRRLALARKRFVGRRLGVIILRWSELGIFVNGCSDPMLIELLGVFESRACVLTHYIAN